MVIIPNPFPSRSLGKTPTIIQEITNVYQETERYINYNDYHKYLNIINYTTYKKHVLSKDKKTFFKEYEHHIHEKRLRDIITSQEAKFWKIISKNVYLNKGRVELDKRLIKNYYKNKGYYEVQVSSSSVEYSEGDGFILTFSIDAGNRYRFKKISLDVAESLDQNAFDSLEQEFDKVVGEYYSQRKLKKILDKIDKLSEQKELQFINHRAVETLDSDTIDIKIEVFEI